MSIRTWKDIEIMCITIVESHNIYKQAISEEVIKKSSEGKISESNDEGKTEQNNQSGSQLILFSFFFPPRGGDCPKPFGVR